MSARTGLAVLAARVARGVVQPGPRSPATGRQDIKGAAAAAYGRRTCFPSAVIWGALTSGACTGGMAIAAPPRRDAEEPHRRSGGQTELAERSRRPMAAAQRAADLAGWTVGLGLTSYRA